MACAQMCWETNFLLSLELIWKVDLQTILFVVPLYLGANMIAKKNRKFFMLPQHTRYITSIMTVFGNL